MRLWVLLALLCCIFGAKKREPRKEGADIGRLRQWAMNRGAWIHPNMRIVDVGIGRGLVTAKPLDKGEQIFYLPRLVWLSDDQAQELLSDVLTPSQKAAVERARSQEGEGCTSNPWHLTLLVLLLGRASSPSYRLPALVKEWSPLIEALPSGCVGAVCGEVKAAKGETERETWMRQCLASLREAGTSLAPGLSMQGAFGPVLASDVHWAISMVTTRLQVISEQDHPMLVPFLDFINAHEDDDCCSSSAAVAGSCRAEGEGEEGEEGGECAEEQRFLTNYTAKRDFAKGEQLHEVYGDLSARELRMLFGFERPISSRREPPKLKPADEL